MYMRRINGCSTDAERLVLCLFFGCWLPGTSCDLKYLACQHCDLINCVGSLLERLNLSDFK